MCIISKRSQWATIFVHIFVKVYRHTILLGKFEKKSARSNNLGENVLELTLRLFHFSDAYL